MPNNKKLGTVTLTLIFVAAVISLRNLPLMASAGMSMFFFYAIAGIGFFIPCALLVAELSTMYPEEGGIYLWAKEAFGSKIGFLAVWFLAARCIACFPPILAFTTGTLAYLINPDLAQDRVYTVMASLGIFWICTVVMFRGPKILESLGNASTFLGTLFPGLLLLGLSAYWLMTGNPSHLDFNVKAIMPNINDLSQIAFLAGTILAFGGIEVGGLYAKQVRNPKATFPKAVIISSILIFIILVLGSLAVAVVVPPTTLSLNSGILQTFSYMFDALHIPQATAVLAVMIAFGTLSILGLCILSPSLGLIVSARQGFLPPFFQKTNTNGVPTRMLWAQGVIVTFFCLTLLILPSTNLGFWVYSAIASSTYLLMYLIFFASGIALRIKYPNAERPFKIPGGLIGMILVGGLGFFSSLFCFFCAFIPPAHLGTGSATIVSILQIGIMLLLCLPPFLLLKFKKRSWKVT